MQKCLLVIDGNSLMHRAFYALPKLSNTDGILTNAVFGFINMFLKLLVEYSPQYIAVAFDMKGPTFRHHEYAEYKGTRQKSPEGLEHQFGLLIELLEAMPVAIYKHEGFEADDILGWLSEEAKHRGIKTFIVTGDKDALQLVSSEVNVLLTKKGISQVVNYDLNELEVEYGLEPWQIIELKALMGDSSDNIPGIPGIGEKTALTLIKQYRSVQGVYDNLEEIKGATLKENLSNNRESAFLSKRLATIIRESPIQINIEDCELKIKPSLELMRKLEWLNFQTLLDKFDFSAQNLVEIKTEPLEKDYITIDTQEFLQKIANKLYAKGRIALLVGDDFTIFCDGLPVYKILLNIKDAFDVLKPLLENEQIDKITFDAKALMHICKEFGINIKGIKFDTFIAAYLLNPAGSKYDLKQLLNEYLKKNNGKPNAEDILRLAEDMSEKLMTQGMLSLYVDIEHPLIELLFAMEMAGFRIDQKILGELDIEFSGAITRLTREVHEFARKEFNINSTKQLGEVLFDKLNLPAVKKTKTGFSTDIEVLDELKGMHPIISAIIDYRQIAKLKSTYIDGLAKMIDPNDGRIHSSFNQTIAVTGRISSTEPNLQNIPVRMEMGRRIRKIFIPSVDHVLVDADYSQIELRILAHLSQDPAFIETFLSGGDIHKMTAAEIFGIGIDEVTSDQRNNAKAVNFGIVYGISDFGLSQNLSVSVATARGYIDRYFNRYPKVRQYLDGLVEFAEKQGYVTTLMGRRRYIPEIKSRNKTIHSLGRRLAMNTPIQGTAADIIKKAMIDVFSELRERNLRSKLILQVHDELIIDTHKDEIEEVEKLLRDNMENVVKLKVPILVEVCSGNNWYNAK